MINITKLKQKLKASQFDAILISSRENVRYLSGFTGAESACVVTQKNAWFITDFRYIEQAAAECGGFRFLMTQSRVLSLGQAILSACEEDGVTRLGFEEHIISYAEYQSFRKILPEKIEILPAGGMVEALRLYKTPDEIELIRKAASIAEKAFFDVLPLIVPGAVEFELANELEYRMRKYGADSPAFSTILISGKKTSLPHGIPSDKKIETGDFVTVDFGATFRGYKSDITRTMVVGHCNEAQKQLYNLVLKAQLAALQAVKAGVPARYPDSLVREIFGAESIHFGHGLGHGVGLEIHEEPRMNSVTNDILAAGEIVTVEPGLYLENRYGVRIEDTVAVTETGCEILNGIAKELMIL